MHGDGPAICSGPVQAFTCMRQNLAQGVSPVFTQYHNLLSSCCIDKCMQGGVSCVQCNVFTSKYSKVVFV